MDTPPDRPLDADANVQTDLESRVARLEGRLVELESVGARRQRGLAGLVAGLMTVVAGLSSPWYTSETEVDDQARYLWSDTFSGWEVMTEGRSPIALLLVLVIAGFFGFIYPSRNAMVTTAAASGLSLFALTLGAVLANGDPGVTWGLGPALTAIACLVVGISSVVLIDRRNWPSEDDIHPPMRPATD